MRLDPLMHYFIRERMSIVQDIYKGDIQYKNYPRFPFVALPNASLPEVSLERVLAHRVSTRSFDTTPLVLSEVGTLLKYAAGIRTDSLPNAQIHRTYPSGGAKFPLELYTVIFNVTGLEPGVYHYNVEKHGLEKLIFIDTKTIHKHLLSHYPLLRTAAVGLFFSSIKSRSMGKYGGFAYKIMLLEAGHISENAYLVSEAQGLGCCGMGVIDPQQLNIFLQLDGINECILYGMSIGKKKT